jgi:hypothetical protein
MSVGFTVNFAVLLVDAGLMARVSTFQHDAEAAR